MSEFNQKQLFGKVRNNCRSVDPITGPTINVVTNVVDLDVRQNRDTVFTISNTGLNSLYYSIRVRNEYATGADFTVFSNDVDGGERDEAILVRHARVLIDVNSHVTDQHTTYSISAIGGT
jgi:hypothetical protein